MYSSTPHDLFSWKKYMSYTLVHDTYKYMYEVCSESNAPDKITYERYTLERWRKNIYFEDGYSLSKSFWVCTAQINHLTGRASQIALEAATPSSPGYDRRTCSPPRAPGLPKVGENKTVGR